MTLSAKQLGLAFGLALSASGSAAFAQDDLVTKGEYLARAGDCVACHTSNEEEPFAGGYAFKMPMGTIYSSNITPSEQYGIGTWTRDEFAKAVRKGVRPDGTHLYPAMPYTAYANITDEDMDALYAYFTKGVAPVDKPLAEQTTLDFPFGLPGTMAVWNTLFANGKPFTPDSALSEEENRGKYLAEGLAHCSTCHTPRNALMAEQSGEFLAGGAVEGWYAPNITSDEVSGIGAWNKEEIVSYLKNGHAAGKAQAGGPMADAVEHSFRFLTDEDAGAIAAYLKTVPAIRDAGQTAPAYAVTKAAAVDWTAFETTQTENDSPEHASAASDDGAMLYNVNCAACHGISGEGSRDGYFPSLTSNTAVGAANPQNLVMAIAEGIHREGADGKAVMPAFSEEAQVIHTGLDNAQIAAVANFVTAQFGTGSANLTGEDVRVMRAGGSPSWLIANAAKLAIAGFVIGGLVVLLLLVLIIRRSRRRAA